MNFVSIDFETANSSRNSICSVGIVVVKNGEITDSYYSLVKPPTLDFDDINISIHGITPKDVKNKPTFRELWKEILPYLVGNDVIAHNVSFDFSALRAVLAYYNLDFPELNYYCSYLLSKKVWPGLLSYKLTAVAKEINYQFKHHEALEDAQAAAKIIIEVCQIHNSESLSDLYSKLEMTPGRLFIDGYTPASIGLAQSKLKLKAKDISSNNTEFDETHPFYQKVVVFTGTLQSRLRKEAMQEVVNLGGICNDGINKHTNFLVMGEQDFARIGGDKSSKIKKAEQLLANGQEIELLSEVDFIRLLS
ncbi:exonuclease domain-containing protein [Paenibacillus albiflavus]|uniref:exonuclease domain-containing protein n=1 Tax=Paenibacillus albiflavus TaxID=2545760 RepID=UPI00140428BF|nr:exonuclease domain-containing protein [Paenibacillus albiflavus]